MDSIDGSYFLVERGMDNDKWFEGEELKGL